MRHKLSIENCTPADTDAVIDVWHQCGLIRSWNNPHLDIKRKLSFQPELFFVGKLHTKIIATAMFGYDGHRGSLYYFAVLPAFQQQGFGRQLLQHGEQYLLNMECPKINLMVRIDNTQGIDYYRSLTYTQDNVVCFGKRLIQD